jgi:hyaluronan synthase
MLFNKILSKKETSKQKKDLILNPKQDRRLLSHVPDKEGIRTIPDRRGMYAFSEETQNIHQKVKIKKAGQRYKNNYTVRITVETKTSTKKITGKCIDISTTGILIKISTSEEQRILSEAYKITIQFTIEPGTMPEGYEMKVKTQAKFVRAEEDNTGSILCGLEFKETLAEYANKKRGKYMMSMSSLLLLFVSFFIILMRVESVIYFKFNKYLYLYSIIAAVFLLSRYFFGIFYRSVPINPDFTPGVTIIIPCFNEEEWIHRTITSCINQDYPIDKLEVIVIDDCSNDRSFEKIKNTVKKIHKEAARYETKQRLFCFQQEHNAGKRDALARGVLLAKHNLLVFVDSDSFLDPFAIRNLVQPFQDPKMGGVSGRTDVANTYTNALTKMQSVRYYIAFRIMKAAESYFDAVTCLSGPLSCYRKDIVLTNLDKWLSQKFLGQRATFGDDRSLTNIVLKNYRTSYQDTAICSTVVPNTYTQFLKQQMRWKRSWLRESIIGASYIWKKEPFMALFFYMGLIVPIIAPIIVLYNLAYVPLTHNIFPTTFLVGILMMSLMMSFTQLFFRKSTTWIFGIYFVLFYEAVLLWQMPFAWFTFWKSTWGTRMTPEDIKEASRKKKRRFNL